MLQDTKHGSLSEVWHPSQTRQSVQNHLLPLSTKLTRFIGNFDLLDVLAQDE